MPHPLSQYRPPTPPAEPPNPNVPTPIWTTQNNDDLVFTRSFRSCFGLLYKDYKRETNSDERNPSCFSWLNKITQTENKVAPDTFSSL